MIGGSKAGNFKAEGFAQLFERLMGVLANSCGGLGMDIAGKLVHRGRRESKDRSRPSSGKCECEPVKVVYEEDRELNGFVKDGRVEFPPTEKRCPNDPGVPAGR